MEIVLPKHGRYVVAVSGGVDSMVLLHMLQAQTGLELIVAHLDHGIRPDAVEDRKLVQYTARMYGLTFVYKRAALGKGASEARARQIRYTFLRETMSANRAQAVITAHHQDDVLETAIINLLRGTNRKGLISLNSRSNVIRPLLGVSKDQLLDYAKQNEIRWREDSTNFNEDYMRNYVRHKLLKRFDNQDKIRLLANINNLKNNDQNLNTLLVKYLSNQSVVGQIDRYEFNLLPHNVAREVLATWLRSNNIRDFNSKLLERLVIAAKVSNIDKVYPVFNGYNMHVDKTRLALVGWER